MTARQLGTDLPRAELSSLSGWTPLPLGAQSTNYTVIVHGYNVSPDGALGDFIPTTMKRLYWAGHPVLSRQRDYYHVVGLTWTGNVINGYPASSLFYFAEDEFRALQTGVPLSRFLSQLRGRTSGRITVVAHSLGNMAVQSALQRVPGGVLDVAAMVDAAVPAEAFDSAYVPDVQERSSLIFPPLDGAVAAYIRTTDSGRTTGRCSATSFEMSGWVSCGLGLASTSPQPITSWGSSFRCGGERPPAGAIVRGAVSLRATSTRRAS